MSKISETLAQNITVSWSVAIFAARESIWTLTKCLSALLVACERMEVTVDILVNGNRPLADEAVGFVNSLEHDECKLVVRVWFIPFGDKAHAWNEYLRDIWRGGEVTFFIDGYAEVQSDALVLMDSGLKSTPSALGATGVPTSGRSASALRKLFLEEGGMHGNLYAVRGRVMATLRERGFGLPLGLYRTDSLLGAVLNYRLDPSQHRWDKDCIVVHPHATWHVQHNSWWIPKNLLMQFKRMVRQAQGVLENRAVREHLAINKRNPERLPRTVNELVNHWISDHPQEARRIFRTHPLTLYAAHKLRQTRNWSLTDEPPILLNERDMGITVNPLLHASPAVEHDTSNDAIPDHRTQELH